MGHVGRTHGEERPVVLAIAQERIAKLGPTDRRVPADDEVASIPHGADGQGPSTPPGGPDPPGQRGESGAARPSAPVRTYSSSSSTFESRPIARPTSVSTTAAVRYSAMPTQLPVSS